LATASLADVLAKHLERTRTTPARLAALTGLARRTLAHWLNPSLPTQKPRHWQDLVKVAAALHLTEAEADEVLRAARHRPLARLRATAAPADQKLFAAWAAPAAPAAPKSPTPFQAILDLPTFVGREAELAQLSAALLNDGRAALCGLRGMGGVGKTSLAAHLAYQLRDQFPDGVLWARLDVSDALAVLGQFADAYGKDVSAHRDLGARAGVVRDLLKDKRALIVLDNAETSAQLRDLLLPSLGRCAVLVTTRADLSVLDGWPKLTLTPFPSDTDDSWRLFERFLGPDYVSGHHAELSEIASLLGHLPLALAIVAGQLTLSPLPVGEGAGGEGKISILLAALRAEATRLGALTRDDQAVRISFDLSFAALTPDQQAFFAALGVFGGEDFGVEAVAAVAETAVELAEARLHWLNDLSLVQAGHAGRWRLHPLLRDYAREQLTARAAHAGVVERALGFYASQAEQLKDSGLRPLLPDLGNVLDALRAAHEHGQAAALVRTVTAVQPLLQALGLFQELDQHAGRALTAARELGQPRALARLLLSLTLFQTSGLNDSERGKALGQEAAALAEAHGEWALAVEAHTALARIAMQARDWATEDAHAARAEALARQHQLDETTPQLIHGRAFRLLMRGQTEQAEAELQAFLEQARIDRQTLWTQTALESLGYLLYYRGRFAEADACYRESLALAEAHSGQRPPGLLAEIAENLIPLQRLDEAEQLMAEALRLIRAGGRSRWLMLTLFKAGDVALARADLDHAEGLWQEAYELAEESRVAPLLGAALGRLGQAAVHRRDLATAQRHLEAAWSLLGAGDSTLQAYGHYWLTELALARGDAEQAHEHGQAAIRLFDAISYWRAAEVRAWLATLSSKAPPAR
jgi:tetratricopeptide (TPR) repeat protein